MTYLQHRTQFDGGPLASQNCTPTSGANGARVATAGRINRSGSEIRALVKRDEETSPATPGWSLRDLDLAMSRLGVPFELGSGGWAGVVAAHGKGFPVVLQGISRVFTSGCSGAFDGEHAGLIYPESHSDRKRWMWGDPICDKARWESIALLRRYAETFDPGVSFGFFPLAVRTYSQAEYDAAVATAKATGRDEGIEAEQRRLGLLFGIIE